jgi:hypothetical protein
MQSPNNVYLLGKITDDPRYDGFSYRGFPECFPRNRTSRDWRVIRLQPTWKPIEVRGRVRTFNDFPCVNLTRPAFSARAVEAMRDMLEPNGELLPLKTPEGAYYAYNTTTIADVLDARRSEVRWLPNQKPITAVFIERYEFVAEKVRDLTIFRIPEEPANVFVTETFATRVRERGLRGFEFRKVWPLPPGVFWLKLAKEMRIKAHADGLPKGQTVKGNTVVIILSLANPHSRGTSAEKRAVERLMDELDALLVDVDSDAPAVGSLEGHDYGVPGECRLFLVCPDADALITRLRPWLKELNWPAGFGVVKRYGHFTNQDAPEELVEL